MRTQSSVRSVFKAIAFSKFLYRPPIPKNASILASKFCAETSIGAELNFSRADTSETCRSHMICAM